VPLVRLINAGKRYGAVIALHDINMEVGAGEVTCVLGDNGAGKSTLIKIIAGLHEPSSGTYEVEGTPVSFSSPREALERGIATVYQDLAVVALMPVWRNFFLGSELRKGPGMDIPLMKKTCKDELLAMGIDLRDVDQPIGTLVRRRAAVRGHLPRRHFGAKVLILDEPTAALGVKQSGVVLKYIVQARERGLGVIFITHNPHHAYPVGDRFLLLNRGASIGNYEKSQVTRDELTGLMAGGSELEQLSHELESAGGAVADLGRSMEEGRRRTRHQPAAHHHNHYHYHHRVRSPVTRRPANEGEPEARGHARLRLGTCPDSWGVWFADDPLQTPWTRFLDEVAEVGYRWLELGPFGYLPSDKARLADELSRRGLAVAGGTVHGFSGLHRPGDWPDIVAITRQVSELTAAVGGRHVIFVPVPGYRDDSTGAFLEPAELDAGQWRTMIRATDDLGKMVAEEYGLGLQFHPHADSHVETQAQTERFLDQTDPRYVNLCLDTGHLAYRHADNVAIINRYPDRIGLRAHQADGPGHRGQGRPRGPRLRPGRGHGRQLRAARRRTGRRGRGQGAARSRPGPFRRGRAGHVPVRLRPAEADRPAYLHLPTRRRHRRGVTMERPRRRHRSGDDRPGPHPPDHPGAHRRVGHGRQRRRRGARRAGRGGPAWRGYSPHRPGPDRDGNVDAVLVASWGPAHEEQVVAAIAAGKPVFCEKPLAPSSAACQRIMDAEMAAGRRLVQVGFMRRYDAGYRAMKAALDDGGLGAPLLMHCAHRNPSVPDYGFTTDMIISDSAVHEIDIVRWLFGEEIAAASVLTPRRSGHAPEGLRDPLICCWRCPAARSSTTSSSSAPGTAMTSAARSSARPAPSPWRTSAR
jgi:ABC-type multidrug transport system ATPase subunit/sugar phosphate isomerase/epimerase